MNSAKFIILGHRKTVAYSNHILPLLWSSKVRSVPGSQQSLDLTCVDVEGKLSLEERHGKYRLRPCGLDLLHAGGTQVPCFLPTETSQDRKVHQATLPQISCKSVQPVPARVEEPFSLVRQSSSGGVTSNPLFPNMP